MEGHRHRGGRVEVAAVLGVADLDGDGDVVVAEQHGVVLSVNPDILTQAASREKRISALSSQVELLNCCVRELESWQFNKSFKLKKNASSCELQFSAFKEKDLKKSCSRLNKDELQFWLFTFFYFYCE